MLLQLFPGKELKHIIDSYEAPDPWTVLELVAKHEKQELKDATIIVVVDGMQNLMASYEDGLRADSWFYQTLTSIGNLAHKGAFLLPCCMATISRPFEYGLKPSIRKCIFLPVISLKTPSILQDDGTKQLIFKYKEDNTVMKLLEGDCGGHARAVELLWNLSKGLDLDKCNVGGLMRTLQIKIVELYKGAFPNDDEVEAIARAVLTHQRLASNKYIPNTQKFPDQVVEPGLI